MNSNNHIENAWGVLFSNLFHRAIKAIRTPSFILTFLIVIVTCGSCGIWLPYLSKTTSIFFRPDAILTYGVSILASIVAEIILSDNRTKNENMLFFSFVVISIIMLVCGLLLTKNNETATLSIIGGVLVLSLWFISNADDEKYDEKQAPNSPLGGTVTGFDRLSGKGL